PNTTTDTIGMLQGPPRCLDVLGLDLMIGFRAPRLAPPVLSRNRCDGKTGHGLIERWGRVGLDPDLPVLTTPEWTILVSQACARDDSLGVGRRCRTAKSGTAGLAVSG